MTPTKKECCTNCISRPDAPRGSTIHCTKPSCPCHQETTGWEDWVRTLANSTNPRDVDLLIAKIKVEKKTWEEAAYNQGKEDAVTYVRVLSARGTHEITDRKGTRDEHHWIVLDKVLDDARALPNTTN